MTSSWFILRNAMTVNSAMPSLTDANKTHFFQSTINCLGKCANLTLNARAISVTIKEFARAVFLKKVVLVMKSVDQDFSVIHHPLNATFREKKEKDAIKIPTAKTT